MIVRRLIACACALALAVPAGASARAAFEPPTQTTSHTVYGDTKYDLQNQQDLGTPTFKGDTKGDTKNDVVAPAGKSAGTDGWRIAAVAEAGLLAAFALGAATFVGRMRPRRGATA